MCFIYISMYLHSTVVIIQYWQHVNRSYLGGEEGRLMNNRSKTSM